jgi:hypothetical protein
MMTTKIQSKERNYISLLLIYFISIQLTTAQQTKITSQFQTAYLDVSGLFGIEEVSQSFNINYTKKKLVFDLNLVLSLENGFKPINSFVGVGYKTSLDSLKKWTVTARADFAHNGALELSLFRPLTTLSYQINKNNTISITNFTFFKVGNTNPKLPDIRGNSTILHFIDSRNLSKKFVLRQEVRVAYGFIEDVRKSADAQYITRITYLPHNIFVGGTIGTIFYEDKRDTSNIYNAIVGINF